MNPEKSETRRLFFKTLKDYKRIIKYKRRKYEENMVEKLENLYSQDRNEFWKYLKSMKNTTKNEDLPQLENLIRHLRKLYFDEEIQNKENNDKGQVNDIQKQKFEILNKDITEDEVTKCIKNLKNRKSPGDDQITNEMIKCTNTGV